MASPKHTQPVAPEPEPDFIPSAPKAKYGAEYTPQETSGPILLEDDQLFTEWYNPTDRDVVLEVHIGTDPKNSLWRKSFLEASPAKRQEMRSGNRIFIVRAGKSREISSEYDLAIQRTHCLHPQCTAKKDCCKDLDHPRVVVAGLAPQLQCMKWHRVPSLSANLDQARAQAEAAVQALSTATTQKIAAELETDTAKKLMLEAQTAAREALAAKARAEAELARFRAAAAKE
jgi:hypothetical protein